VLGEKLVGGWQFLQLYLEFWHSSTPRSVSLIGTIVYDEENYMWKYQLARFASDPGGQASGTLVARPPAPLSKPKRSRLFELPEKMFGEEKLRYFKNLGFSARLEATKEGSAHIFEFVDGLICGGYDFVTRSKRLKRNIFF
jgi:hypothetical protein